MQHLANNHDETNDTLANDNLANRLNQECYCITLDRKALNTSLLDQLIKTGNEPIAAEQLDTLFSTTPIFVPKAEIETMVRVVESIELAAELPSYQQQVLSWAPEVDTASKKNLYQL